ncbi:MAG TPA: hypothetical protein VNA88_07760 [Candidatus Kapabacteria bacterium]|nr:hypothetical protein [Candidatus Kapabacteria bacterium]
MPRPRRYRLWRLASALFVATALWGVVSLNGTYSWTLGVPVRVELARGESLVEPIPEVLDLTVRTDGWSLMSLLVARRVECVLRPPGHGGAERSYLLTRNELLRNIQTTVGREQLVSIAPDSILMRLGPVETRRVPLRAEATIETKPGFQVIGPLRVIPDSVLLSGSSRVLPMIDAWETEHVRLTDVYQPINRRVTVSDSMPGVVRPALRTVRLVADVQEIAERSFPDIPVLNRSTIRDTSVRLVLQPPRITVMVRGGARDLSRLSPTEIRAYVEILEGVDTIGVAQPRVTTPHGSHFSVVAYSPKQVRYLWRRQ